MFEIPSILAPTDFSHHAQDALAYACGLANRMGSSLHLLHVLPDMVVPVGPDPSLITALPPEFYQETEAQTREALEQAIDANWPKPPALHCEIRWGDPVHGIVEYAREKQVKLIVIATHGRTGLSHVLLGSVAERIVRESPCPVLTIRNGHV